MDDLSKTRMERELRTAWRASLSSAKVWRARAERMAGDFSASARMLADCHLDIARKALSAWLELRRPPAPDVEPCSQEDYRQTWRFAIDAAKKQQPHERRGDVWVHVAAMAFSAYRTGATAHVS